MSGISKSAILPLAKGRAERLNSTHLHITIHRYWATSLLTVLHNLLRIGHFHPDIILLDGLIALYFGRFLQYH